MRLSYPPSVSFTASPMEACKSLYMYVVTCSLRNKGLEIILDVVPSHKAWHLLQQSKCFLHHPC